MKADRWIAALLTITLFAFAAVRAHTPVSFDEYPDCTTLTQDQCMNVPKCTAQKYCLWINGLGSCICPD